MVSRDEEHQNVVAEYELPHPFYVVSKITAGQGKRKRGQLGMDDQSIDPRSPVVPNPVGEQVARSGPPLANGHAISRSKAADSQYFTPQRPLLRPYNQDLPLSLLEGSQPGIGTIPPLADNLTINVDGLNVILSDINPQRGPITGGDRIVLIGSNFPSSGIFARFGSNVAQTV